VKKYLVIPLPRAGSEARELGTNFSEWFPKPEGDEQLKECGGVLKMP